MPGSLLGNAVRRVEDPDLLAGRAAYVDDLPIDGALQLAFVRSPIAHATIRSVDTSDALTMPGVVAVFTAGASTAVYSLPVRLQNACHDAHFSGSSAWVIIGLPGKWKRSATRSGCSSTSAA